MKKIITTAIIIFFQNLIYAQNVNQFTGSFDYSIPLLNLPSDRGNGISIDAAYNAGIQVNQASSQIGLGWNLNAGGAIYRSVSGFPDDMPNYQVHDMINNKQIIGQGSMFLNTSGLSGPIDYDLITTQKGPKLDTAEFITPAFDMYNVDGPAFGGQMKMSYLNFYSYRLQNMGTTLNPDNKLVPNTQNLSANSFNPVTYIRKPQFHFTGDFADTLVSRHYTASINSSTPFKDPTDLVTGLGYSSGNNAPYVGKHLSGSTISNQNFDMSSGRLASSNFIEYFTNQEINTANTNGFASGTLSSFIDFQSSHSRSTGNFPSDGIGYFRITGSNGLTYHYSLPVYTSESVAFSTPLNYDYSIPTAVSSATNLFGSNNPGIAYPPAYSNLYIKYTNANRYAIKWLLTAVTGRDYEDKNNNHMVDSGDEGYWICYDYQLWSSDFVTRSPYYGFDYQFSPDDQSNSYPIYYPIAPINPGRPYKLSGLFANANVNKGEVYYLSKIKSSSHTVIFVMDTRKDEKGGDDADISSSSFKPAPSLLIKRILLFKNESLESILLTNSPIYSQSNYTNNSQYDFTNINSSSNFFTETWYQQSVYSLQNTLLKNIEFDQDYSLSKKYHGNIEVKCNGSNPLSSPLNVQGNLTVANNTSSGKLTLKRILTFENQNVKVTPSVIFDYQSDVANGNPDYNPIKTDYWGYYKSDATENGYSKYTNAISKEFTKAWSLNKITDPLGGVTLIEYESNSYNKVIDVEKGKRGPVYIYRVKDVDTLWSKFHLIMEEGSNPTYPLNEFLSLSTNTLSGIARTAFLPYASPEDPSVSSSTINSNNGFGMSNCTFTVIGGLNNPTNHVMGNYTSSNNAASRTGNSRNYIGDNVGNYWPNTHHSYPGSLSTMDLSFSGNGFLIIEMPIGYEAYGGGIRVKNIKTYNVTSETYVEQYTYENGVAGNEMDRFDYQVQKTGCGGGINRYKYFSPKNFTLFDIAPTIGYTKVTVKNLGRINTPNGKTETTFITDPSDENGLFSNNFSINTFTSGTYGTDLYRVTECINQFSSIFGATKQVIEYDKNDNQISKNINTYTTTQQGALTEILHFEDPNYFDAVLSYSVKSSTVNIMRDNPVVLKSTTTYGMGTVKTVETLSRDELTGEGTSMRTSGNNKSTSIAYKIPAYKQYLPIENMDFSSAESRKMIPFGQVLYTYSNVDTTLSQTQGNGYSASFLNASYKLYSRNIRLQYFDLSLSTLLISQYTLPYYVNNRNFIFDGGSGSIDQFGLLKKSNLNSNSLNLTTINSTALWEPTSSHNWKLLSEATLWDKKSHVLESRDMNDRFKANKYGYNNYYVNSKVSNCNYASYTFADFESNANFVSSNGTYWLDGEMRATSFNLINGQTITPHTGSRCVEINTTPIQYKISSLKSPGNSLDLGLLPGRIYRSSVWVHNTNASNATMIITIDGTVNSSTSYSVITANVAGNLVTTIGNWNLIQVDFEVPEGFSTSTNGQFKIELKSILGSVYFDDFIFRPVEGDFTGSVYDPANGRLISSIDANGLSTNYFYDASGKVIEVWQEYAGAASTTGSYKKIKANTYNYARGATN